MPKNTSESAILTIKEVAEYLKITAWRLRATDIDGWIADQSKKAEGTD